MGSTDDILNSDEGVQGDLVMPFYLVCDVSRAMGADIGALHNAIAKLWSDIASMPSVDDVTWLSLIAFSDQARVLVRLSQANNEIPAFAHEGSTQYGNVFRLLAKELAEDYAMLNRKGARIYRPCVYFVTGGEPSDSDWRQTFKQTLSTEALALRDVPSYALIVPFGFREATERTLAGLAYPRDRSKYYHASKNTIDVALRGLLGIIKNSILNSLQSGLTDQPTVDLPKPDPRSGISCGDSESSIEA